MEAVISRHVQLRQACALQRTHLLQVQTSKFSMIDSADKATNYCHRVMLKKDESNLRSQIGGGGGGSERLWKMTLLYLLHHSCHDCGVCPGRGDH